MSDNLYRFGRIGVLMGGYSSEREVSLKSGTAIYESLLSQGLNVAAVDINTSDLNKIKLQLLESRIDIAFIALHGKLGEDGVIQSILEDLCISYVGSGVKASQLAINKLTAHQVFRENNIPTAKYISLLNTDKINLEKIINDLDGFPLVISPHLKAQALVLALPEILMSLNSD